jgi:trehalose synthase-fused probable maltokinase
VRQPEREHDQRDTLLPMVEALASEESFLAALHRRLPEVLPEFLVHRRWFGGKARAIESVEISDVVPIHRPTGRWYVVLAKVRYAGGSAETYDIPLVKIPSHIERDPTSVLKFRTEGNAEEVVLADALSDEEFLRCLLEAIAQGACLVGARGQIRAISTSALATLWQSSQVPLPPSLMNAEQSNSSVIYGQRLVLKIFRRVGEGLNPDLEIGSFLTEKTSFRNVPVVAGYLEYTTPEGNRTALGVLQSYVANQGDAWQFTLRALSEYYEKAPLTGIVEDQVPPSTILALSDRPVRDEVSRRIGSYLDSAALLGRRTAELHLALASALQDPDFTPQSFTKVEQQAFVSSALALLTSNFDLLRRRSDGMPGLVRQQADKVLSLEDNARQRLRLLAERDLSVVLTRIHGDYHLGQVLFTGSDFVIIDFEGEPARSLEERRKKRSPLQDVAGMLRSFHYAAYAPLLQPAAADRKAEGKSDERLHLLANWASYWQKWVSATFLRAYFEISRGAQFIPESREELALLLDAFLLDKAVYELGYELNNRPSWVRIPLDGISQLLLDPA